MVVASSVVAVVVAGCSRTGGKALVPTRESSVSSKAVRLEAGRDSGRMRPT